MYSNIIKNQLPEDLYVNDEINKKEVNVLGNTLDKLQNSIDYLENEILVVTANDIGLDKKEEIFNIPTNKGKPVDQRRSFIISRYRGNSNATIDLIKSIAESYSNGAVEVLEDYPNYMFTIKFVGTKGIPPNMEDLKEAVEVVKHAHLAINYVFIYLHWDELDNTNLNFNELDTFKWDELEKASFI